MVGFTVEILSGRCGQYIEIYNPSQLLAFRTARVRFPGERYEIIPVRRLRLPMAAEARSAFRALGFALPAPPASEKTESRDV